MALKMYVSAIAAGSVCVYDGYGLAYLGSFRFHKETVSTRKSMVTDNSGQ